MAFNILGDAKELCFDPYFAAIQRFLQATSESTGIDILLTHGEANEGFVLIAAHVASLAEDHIHEAWESLLFWSAKRYQYSAHPSLHLRAAAFSPELVACSLKIPSPVYVKARSRG